MYVYSRLIVAGAHHSVFVARSVSLSVSQSLSVSVHNRTAQRICSTRLSDEPVQRDDINGVPTGTTSSLDLISLSNSVYTMQPVVQPATNSRFYNRLHNRLWECLHFTTGWKKRFEYLYNKSSTVDFCRVCDRSNFVIHQDAIEGNK